MPPAQGTVIAVPTAAKSPTRHVSIPAMVMLVLFLIVVAVLAIGVILRQRSAVTALKYKEQGSQENRQRSDRTGLSWFSRFANFRPTAVNKLNTDNDGPTTVGALHATSVLLAAAPCQVFSAPMTMHFKIPLQDKTILILGTSWFPVRNGAQYRGIPAVKMLFWAMLERHIDLPFLAVRPFGIDSSTTDLR